MTQIPNPLPARLLNAIALPALGFGIVLLLLELALRVVEPPPAPSGPEPSVAALREPHLDATFRGIHFRTNRYGFRGPEREARAAPGVRRIAITGDSFVMGWGVSEQDSYPVQLERLLNESAGRERFEVINVGLVDINIAEAMERLQIAVDAYAPDIVVYGATLNDIVGPHFERTYPALRGVALALRYRQYEDSPSHLLRFVWPRWVALNERFAPSIDWAQALAHNYFDNAAAWQDFEAGLDEFAAIAGRSDACGHVLIHANLNDLDADHVFLDIYRKIAAAARARGISATESFAYFAGMRPLDVKLSIADGHPNPAGHALLARALFDGLRALPGGCAMDASGTNAEAS